VFMLVSFQEKWLAVEFWTFGSLSRCFGEPDRRELQKSSFEKTKAQRRVFVSSIVRQ